jgi:hypothetical protein
LNSKDLCHVDAACRLLSTLNGLPAGPWHSIGDRTFYGMELEVEGAFLLFEQARKTAAASKWKAQFEKFQREVGTFSLPFVGSDISTVDHPDEVAYCRCRLRTDLLTQRPDQGVYVEVEVVANADNLSLAVVDFEGGGRSSVTFSPETGAVLRERKVRESPRAIEGTYLHLLPAAPQQQKFEGSMGLYLRDGHLAFFRRWARRKGEDSQSDWETTGFCTNMKWAQGPRLSMCLAFRDNGEYRVRISRVSREPPAIPQRSGEAYKEEKWNKLYGDDDHPLAI